jgi:hypothetical protein
MVRKVLVRQLTTHGYRVLAAPGGPSAVEQAQRHEGPLPLLLTDVVMNGENGPQVAERIRALRPDIRVIFMSGYAEGAIGQELKGAFLQKPFTDDELARCIRRVLDGAAPGKG